jgi:hypothetical protein
MAQRLIALLVSLLFLHANAAPAGALQAQTRSARKPSASHSKARARRVLNALSLQQRGLEEILTDLSLWGEKFSSLLAALPAFAGAGESQVWVFPNRVVGGNKFRSKDEAERQLKNLSENLKKGATPRSDKLRTYMAIGVTPLKPTVILFRDDRSYRVAAEGGPFLQPGLTITDVRKRLGKEERVTTQMLDDGTEHRPVILTLHFYAGGAIAFAESDISATIGSVDRVLLDTSKISATLF